MHLPFSRPACGPLDPTGEDRGPQAGRLNGGKIELVYAPPLPVHRRRAFRWVLAIAIVVAVAASERWWAPPLWLRIRLLYYQRQCLLYEPPAGQIVGTWTGGVESGSVQGVVPTEWVTFYGLYSPPGFKSSATLFLHERRTPSGRRRLVAVDLTWNGGFLGSSETVEARVFVPGDLFGPPREALTRSSGPSWLLPAHPPQFCAGSADPADPTHFTFVVIDAGQRETIDGWLGDDDAVHFERPDGR